ncbi:hypothetical protein GOP47_0026058 [Adiantum capillus-veneris]|uniref:Uncharacterized protein n=1 Tax=Adiantum capillus-veneris TaxID=13818 RepID=A0A9D4Z3F5_ADICA|nr:hypothetical protein GOP47_0026058 [Adiantum capillus-veneris]
MFFQRCTMELVVSIRDGLLFSLDINDRIAFIFTHLLGSNSEFSTTLLQLVKEVWLLHKLVFSFNALLLRVPFLSFFNEQYMDAMEESTICDDNLDDLPVVKQVLYVGVPGFFCR